MLAISYSNHGETVPGSYMVFIIDLLARSSLSVPFSQFAKAISKGDWTAVLLYCCCHSTKISKYVSNPVQILNLTGGFWGFSLCDHCGKQSQRIELWLLKDTQSSLADWTAKGFFPASSARQNNQHVFSLHRSFPFAVLDNNWRPKTIPFENIYKITILSSWMVVGFEQDCNIFMNVILCELWEMAKLHHPPLPPRGGRRYFRWNVSSVFVRTPLTRILMKSAEVVF